LGAVVKKIFKESSNATILNNGFPNLGVGFDLAHDAAVAAWTSIATADAASNFVDLVRKFRPSDNFSTL
jgi:hypothetical protein